MEISGYIAVIRRWWWTLLVATWVAGLLGLVVASRLPPTYESRTQLLVGPINGDIDTLRASSQLVLTDAQLVTSDPLLQSTIDELKLGITPDELAQQIRATANDTTRYLTIRVQAGSPQLAADIAKTLADNLVALASRGISRPEGELQITTFAKPEPTPVAPEIGLIAVLSAATGLVGSIVIILLLEYFSTSVRSPEELPKLTGLPVLGVVGQARIAVDPSGRPTLDTLPPNLVNRLELIAARVLVPAGPNHVRRLMVVDSGSGETAALVAAGIAAAVARSGRRTILVDGDTTSGRLSRLLELDGRRGLSELLAELEETAPEDTIDVSTRLTVIPRGAQRAVAIPDPERTRQLFDRLLSIADVVVVAAAPLQAAASTLSWAQAAEGTVIVVERDRSRRETVAADIESLRLAGARAIGTLVETSGGGRGHRVRRVKETGIEGSILPALPPRGGPRRGQTSPRADGARARRASEGVAPAGPEMG